jgi:type I restriction enzyme S subunit
MSILMKDSGIEWIGKTPENWTKDKLFRITDFVSSGGTPTSTNPDYYDGDIIWIQTGDLNDGYIIKTSKKINQYALDNSSAKLFDAGTLLIAMYGATIGKLGIMTKEAATNQACCAIKYNKKIDTKYMYYVFFAMRTHLINQSYGGGQPNISQEVIKQQYLTFPKKTEQKKIVDFLDKATLQIDDAIKTKEKQLKTLEALKKSIIHKAVTKGLDDSVEMIDSKIEWIGDIPKHWNLKRVKDFSIFSPSIGNVDDNDEVTVVPMELVSENGNMSVDNILELKFVTKGLTPFQNNDVIMAKITPCMENGKAAFVNKLKTDVALGSTEFFVMRPIEFLINGKFLYYCIFNEQFRKFAEINMTGAAGQKRVPSKFLKFSKFPFPFKIEQEKIEKYLDTEVEKINTLKENVKKQIDKLKEYKKSLIYEYVTGKKQIKG